MKAWSVKPNQLSYNTVMDAYARAGRVGDAVKVFNTMKARTLGVSVSFYFILPVARCPSSGGGIRGNPKHSFLRITVGELNVRQSWTLRGPLAPHRWLLVTEHAWLESLCDPFLRKPRVFSTPELIVRCLPPLCVYPFL